MKPNKSTGFAIGMLGLLGLSLVLRFWGLERFNTLVFDEVYYAKFAHNYLTHTPFFDGHPPLSKYLIAIGIWLGNQLPFGKDAINGLAGGLYSTWSYRWLNALTGSLIPLVVAGIAYQLLHRRSYALIAGLFAALDGIFLVESRYALNNVYLVLFGLLGLWFLLLALSKARSLRRDAWLALAGIFFGASASVKWNGLWFLLGAYGIWVSAWIVRWGNQIEPSSDPALQSQFQSPVARLTQLKWWQIGLNLVAIPALVYWLEWIPHLRQNPGTDFWELQKQILAYHERVGSGPTVHPYCSPWYSWLVMWRPVAYFYQVTEKGAALPDGKSALAPTADRIIYDVHAMGNPFLWWFSTAAIAIVLSLLVQRWWTWVTAKQYSGRVAGEWPSSSDWFLVPAEGWLILFLSVNYAANLLPWMQVSRCVFLYHYMGASIFAELGLAWLVDRWFHSQSQRLRLFGIATILLVGLAFVFWLPMYLGLPLSLTEFRLRIWFPSWI